MKFKLLTVLIAGMFLCVSFHSEAQKSNILIEKGLARLASTQSTSKGLEMTGMTSINPNGILPIDAKALGNWGGAGISSLCLQAFLQNGHNIDDPDYGTVVTNAINYILGTQIQSGTHLGAFSGWTSYGYETGMAIGALKLALETPLHGGGFIADPLRSTIQTAVDDGINYFMQDVNDAWTRVSWRYDRNNTSGNTGTSGGDMSVNQWVYLAFDAVDENDKDIWNKIYNYMNDSKCASGGGYRIGYQTCGTRPQGMTCAGIWGSVLAADHGVGAASTIKNEFLAYLQGFSLVQLINRENIGGNQIYSGGGYYYYLYGFAKAMALSNKTKFPTVNDDWYISMYNNIESYHQTDGNGNYYWDDWGGSGSNYNMETALALLCLQTQTVPEGSTFVVSLDTDVTKSKDDCLEFTIFDEVGNEAGKTGGVWYTNIPNTEWTSTTGDFYELTIELEESANFSAEIKNTCIEPQVSELCFKSYLQEELTDEECFILDDHNYLVTIGATAFVNAIGGLNIIIVVPPTPIPVMELDPAVIAFNPFEYDQTYDFTFDVMETGGETPLANIDLFPSDLVDQYGNVVPDANFTLTPNHIDAILPGEFVTVQGSVTTPASFSKNPLVGLFQGNITAQTGDQTKGINFEIGAPEMTIDPDEALVSYTNGATTFDISFAGLQEIAWSIDNMYPWVSADPLMGNGDETVTVTYDANPGGLEREAILLITAPDAENPDGTFTLTQEATPYPFFVDIELIVSMDQAGWYDADGDLETGFGVGLATTVPEYYLDLGDNTMANTELMPDYYPFYLNPQTVPDGFYEYWEGRGVYNGCPGTWEPFMYQIIIGDLPTFYIHVIEPKGIGQEFMLVDGLHKLIGQPDTWLQVPGDYPFGMYDYYGSVEDMGGQSSNQIDVMIEFYDATPGFAGAELITSIDKVDWETAWGNFENGYLVRLDETVDYYYLDLGPNTSTTVPIMPDMYPFYLDPSTVPDGFYDFWADKGVFEGCTGDWQPTMWEIINGIFPTFFIEVMETDVGAYMLVDGLQWIVSEGALVDFLRVNGLYPHGTYKYTGYLEGPMEVMSEEIPVWITFASDIDQQIELTDGWMGISSYIIPEEPALEVVMADIADQMEIMLSYNGIFWPGPGINTIGDWNSYTGYKIKINEATVLEMFGFPTETTVSFGAGASFLPVLVPDAVAAADVLDQAGEALVYAYNIQEQLIYWPQGGLATLTTLEPGIGYLLFLTEGASFDFAGKATSPPQVVQTFVNSTPWNDVVNTANPHIISIGTAATEELQTGDVVGAFDVQGVCVGMAGYGDSKNNLPLVVFGRDLTVNSDFGLSEGEAISFKLYRVGEGEFNLDVTFDPSFNTGVFESMGLSMITDMKAGILGIGNNTEIEFSIYPNPSNGIFNIQSDDASITVVNAQGQIVHRALVGGNATLDLSHLGQGMYFIQLANEKGLMIKKIAIQ